MVVNGVNQNRLPTQELGRLVQVLVSDRNHDDLIRTTQPVEAEVADFIFAVTVKELDVPCVGCEGGHSPQEPQQQCYQYTGDKPSSFLYHFSSQCVVV